MIRASESIPCLPQNAFRFVYNLDVPKVRDPVALQGQVSYSQAADGMGSEYATELSNRVLRVDSAMIWSGNIARLARFTCPNVLDSLVWSFRLSLTI
jgi:hypothetical protein